MAGSALVVPRSRSANDTTMEYICIVEFYCAVLKSLKKRKVGILKVTNMAENKVSEVTKNT
jgi:hypothetical protein